MDTQIRRELNKLFRAYDKAEHALIMKRDELFPPGCRVRSCINPEYEVEVKSGSFYPHQVLTSYGHMSWRYLERIGND